MHRLAARHREVWAGLPEAARRRALALLARMMARGVLDAGVPGGGIMTDAAKIASSHRSRRCLVYLLSELISEFSQFTG